jgi:hypothetical protein
MLPAAGALGTRERETVERIEKKLLIVGVGAANRQAQRHAATVGESTA